MSLSEAILKKLSRKYNPQTTIHMRHRGKDLVATTDKDGNPIQLFIGRLQENGHVKGERYSRRMVKNAAGELIRDHWDRKGFTH